MWLSKINFIFCFFCFSLLSFNSNGQLVSGQVKSIHGNPIPFASIHVLNSPIQTVSDSLGRFKLSLSQGKYQLQIQALGYASKIEDIEVSTSDTNFELFMNDEITTLDEIIITANKKEENIIVVPVSATILTAEKINETRTWELEDLKALVPNYQYADLGVNYQQVQSIRGISVFSENPSVATYIDGVSALDVNANGIQFTDIERIEVLRGPQSTLYGRSAMGGVINIITKQPSNKTSMMFESSIGNQGLQRYALALKTPLKSNKLYIGINGQYQKQYGYYYNDLSNEMSFDGQPLKGISEDGQRVGDEESYYGNFLLKYIVNKNIDITFNSKFQKDQSIGASMYYQAVENEKTAIKNPYKLAVNKLGSHKRNINNNALSINYKHQYFQLTSVSSYQFIQQYYQNIDQDLTAYDLATGSTFHHKEGDAIPQQVLNQEIRLTSPNTNKKIKWTLGTYAFYQKYDKRYATRYERLALFFGETPGLQVAQNDEQNYGLALFAQTTYSLKEKMEFTLGLRYDSEWRKSTISKFNMDSLGNINYTVPEFNRSIHFSAFSPKAIITYLFQKNHHLYLSYSKGFRAGGINTASNLNGYETYNPEYSDNIELGHKINSKNGKHTLQTSLFYLYWTNLQLDLRTDNGIYVMHNIGNVKSMGFEIETSSKLIKRLRSDISIGYNNSHYQDFVFLNDNIKGNTTILTPSTTIFTGLQYELKLFKNNILLIRGEWRNFGKQYFDLANTIAQPNYSVFNSRIELKHNSMSIAFWVNNILNKNYISYSMPGYFKYTIINRPRSIGLTLKISI
jgi:iron complex outermembrane receptor protein